MCLTLHNIFFSISLFISFICVYFLNHEFFRLWIYLLLILIKNSIKKIKVNILFYVIEYLDVYLLIL